MAIPTLLLPFEGSLAGRDRSGIVTPTATGPVRYTAGANGAANGAYIAEEGTTNLVQNPSAGTDLIGWSQQTADTMARSTSHPELHATAVAATFSASSDFFQVSAPMPTATAGDVFTGSAWMVGNGTVRVSIHLYGAGNLDGSQATYTLTGTPQRVIAPSLTANGAYTGCVFRVFAGTTGYATTLAISKVQIEEKAYATSYCDGSLGNGYTWAGAAHASASTRAAAAVTYPSGASLNTMLSPQRGALAMRLRVPALGGSRYPFRVGVGTSAGTTWLLVTVGTSVLISWQTSGAGQRTVATPAPVPGSWLTLVTDWDGLDIGVSVNGGVRVAGTRDTPSAWGSTGMHIGSPGWGDGFLNEAVDALLIFDRPLTSAERTKLVNAPSWKWDTLLPRLGGILRVGGSEPLGVLRVGGSNPLVMSRSGGSQR